MRLNPAPQPSDRFTYNDATKLFIAEASDLQNQHLNRLYDDACDVGLVIESTKTGKLVRYYMSSVVKDGDGDVESWNYYPTTESLHEVPECVGTSVTVFND
jgi:hypothetical protein